MENNIYNSLTEKLIQNGILGNEKTQIEIPLASDDDRNIFKKSSNVEIPAYMLPAKKRLNQLDLELINRNQANTNKPKKNFIFRIASINRFFTYDKNIHSINGSKNFLDRLCFAFLPKIHKAKLVKEAMAIFSKLDIDITELSDKAIPYGEAEDRYQNLIKYIKFANDIQIDIKRKS